MNNPSPQSQRLWELVCLPPQDPRRAAVLAEIEAMDREERDYWLNMLRESDEFHLQIRAVQMPAGLEARLLNLPDAPIPLRLPPRTLLKNVWFQRLAAAAAILIILAVYLYWPASTRPAQLLDDQIAVLIARQAAENNPPLNITSNNADQVKTALSAQRLPFPVMILQPKTPLDLRGGGVCDFHGTPAVFTRWQGDGRTYTLYQFNGKPLGVPGSFLKTTEIPKEFWHDDYHPRVVIFAGSGGLCTWALVMDSDTAKDVFSGYF
jgi:hypothetical protein